MKMTLIALTAAVLLGGCLAGCKSSAKNQSEIGIRYGTEVTFFSRAAQTSPEAGSFEVTVDDRLMKLVEPKPPESARGINSDED